MSRLLLAHGRILNPGGVPSCIENGYILIRGETIEAVGDQPPEHERAEQVVDLNGKTVLPGLINVHTHLYSSLALGMPGPAELPGGFVEILEQIWWKLDRALDKSSTLASFEAGLAASLRAGVTTVFDHHSSQNYIAGSMEQLVEAAGRFGVNISPCFEITDRNGPERFKQGLLENLETFHRYSDDPYVHPLIGLHASFTLSDESLAKIGAELQNLQDGGVHIHLAEDQADELDAQQRGYASVVQRLRAFDLINDRCLFAHGLHVLPEDIRVLKDAGVAVVHNPTSNANNRVGLLPETTIKALDVGLGTDGMQADLLAEAKEGMLIRSSHLPAGVRNVNYVGMLFDQNPNIASHLFGCKLGRIMPGYRADLAIYDYRPGTGMNAANLPGHILYGLDRPCDVLTRGEFRIRDGEFQQIDEAEIIARSRRESARLWAEMAKL